MDDAHDVLAYRSPDTAAKIAAPFDGLSLTGQNGVVRRLMLLAIGLSALLWTASARTGWAPSAVSATIIDAGSCRLAGDSHHSGDSDRQWRTHQPGIAAVTESTWKAATMHAALGATISALVFEPLLAASSPDPQVRSALPYLRHTPLLI